MTAGTYDLTTVAAVQQALGITGNDALLQQLISAASRAIIRKTSTDFVQHAYSEPYTWDEFGGRLIVTDPPANFIVGGSGQVSVKLHHRPIYSVTSIVDPAGNTMSSTYYVIHKQRGILEGSFTPPFDSSGNRAYWTISYTAGTYANTAALVDVTTGDPDVEEACILTVGSWFNRDNGEKVSSKSVGSLSLSYAVDVEEGNRAIPSAAMELLGPYLNVAI